MQYWKKGRFNKWRR